MKTLQAAIGNKELLDLYGYEPYYVIDRPFLEGEDTVTSRWSELAHNWHPSYAEELGHLRQIMLQIHLDLCPDDERWR